MLSIIYSAAALLGQGSVFVLPVSAEDRPLSVVQIAWADATLRAKLIFIAGLYYTPVT